MTINKQVGNYKKVFTSKKVNTFKFQNKTIIFSIKLKLQKLKLVFLIIFQKN